MLITSLGTLTLFIKDLNYFNITKQKSQIKYSSPFFSTLVIHMSHVPIHNTWCIESITLSIWNGLKYSYLNRFLNVKTLKKQSLKFTKH